MGGERETVPKVTTTHRVILAAAERVVQATGGMSLTLDAVAREAGMSKGGLLYHFPTKEALVSGLIAAAFDRFEATMAAAMTVDDGPEAGRWVRAYVRANFADDPHERDLTTALVAAVANDPEAIKPKLARLAQWQARAGADGLDPARAAIVTLAADGVWAAELFGIAAIAEPLRERVRDLLLQMATPPEKTEETT